MYGCPSEQDEPRKVTRDSNENVCCPPARNPNTRGTEINWEKRQESTKETKGEANTYTEERIDAMLVVEAFLWRLGRVALEADLHRWPMARGRSVWPKGHVEKTATATGRMSKWSRDAREMWM